MPWVAGHLSGGIGNRLFQHAAAAGLAERWGYTCALYKPGMETTNHAEVDTIYDLFPKTIVVEQEETPILLTEPQGACFTYCPWPDQPPAPGRSYLVDGWRQTPLYFPQGGINVDIDNAVGPERMNMLRDTYGLNTEYARKHTWFVHFRFGDYLLLPHHQIHLGSYYAQAIQQIPADARILIFSDEAKQYKSLFYGLFAHRRADVTIVEDAGVLESLGLMASCWGGAIVANSTFSWWGAYLAHRRAGVGHKACYPRIWGKGLPPAWHVIPDWGTIIENEA